MSLFAAAVLVALLLGWILPTVARWAGILIVLDSLLGLALGLGHGTLVSLMWLVIGTGLWLIGHWIFAYRSGGYYRSWLAYQAFGLPVLRAAAPART